MATTRGRATAILAGLIFLLSACGSDDSGGEGTAGGGGDATEEAERSPSPDDTGPAVYVADEFSFDGPDTIPAGETTIGLENKGNQPHQLLLIELLRGKTLNDVMAVLEKNPDGPPPSWVRVIRKRAFAKPGKSDELTAELTPGSYLLLCFIPDKKTKQPHAALGMVKPVTVE
jgi:hypothetical protein